MNIAQIRAKYPQYSDLSDKQLADALHSKFYSDLPIQDYYKRIGFAPEPAAVSKIKSFLPAPVADVLHQVADVPIGFQKGITRGIRAVSDIFGANNAFSRSLKQNEEALADLMSAQAKNDQQEIARILKEAEDKGVLDQIKAGVKAFTVAPVDTLTSAFGTAAPAIVAALGAKVLGAGALLTTGVSVATGAGMGTGTIKGTIYEETKKALEEAGVPESIAEERAKKAQEYGGQNLDQIIAGAVIGGVAAKGPLEKGAVRAIASRISKNVAAREAAESVPEKAVKGATTGRIRAGVAEALPEAGQAAQEQIAANIAQQREGLDVPTFRGAVAAGTMEGLAGAGLGAMFGGERARGAVAPPPGAPAGETPIERAERLAAEKAPPPAPPAAETPAPPTPPAPPVAEEPPAPETPAPAAEPPAIPEPKVRKVGEPIPLPDVLDSDTVKRIGFPRGKVHDALVGKSVTDPEIRTVLEEYLNRPNANTKTAEKINAFLARLPEPVAPPTAETPTPPAAEAAPSAITAPANTSLTFETAKGSQYSVFDDGTTQRNKAPRPEHPGDQGIKERTARTIYVDGDASRLSAAGVENMEGARVIIDDDGTASLVWKNPKTGRLGSSPASSKIKFYNEPAIGRSPLELWSRTEVAGREGYSGMHAGNKIVKITPVLTETPSVTPSTTEPEAGGAGAPVVSEPSAGAAPGGPGVPEPSGVVPAVADAGQPPAREGQQPVTVTPAKPAESTAPTFTEAEIEDALAANLITSEQAERAREELRAEEPPSTAMGAAFQKQIDNIKAQMDALRQKNGKPPAKKSPAREKYDALAAQLDTLLPAGTGTLEERLEKAQATGVFTAAGSKPVVDLDALRDALVKARAEPKMYKAVLTYIGVNEDGTYLPTTYTADEAAKSVGLAASSGANVRRIANQLGLTAEVISRFHAGQTDVIVTGKNVSEAGTGLTDVQPKRGVLYEPATKREPAKAAAFLRAALTADGKLDFSALTDRQVAEMYARASNFDPKRETNIEVIKQLNGEIDVRTKKDRRSMQQALDSAYRVVRTEEEAAAEEGTPAVETAAPDQAVSEDEEFEESEVEDKTQRLSDEDLPELPGRPTPGVTSPAITRAAAKGDTRRALQAVRETPDATPLDQEIAQRFLGLGQFLGLPKIEIRPAAEVKGSAQYNPKTDTISIADGQEDTHTVLHETTHAFVHKLIVANEKGLRNDAGYRDLKRLYDYLKKTYPALEKEYGMSSLTEFASEAMSNPQFQKKLGTIRYETRTAWTRFVESVRKLLKIGAGDSSALVEAIAGVDSLLRVGREYQTTGPDIDADVASVITPEAEATAKKLGAIGEKEETSLSQRVGRQLAGNKALRLREKFTDSLAPLEDFFVNAYGGQIRTATGRLNPMVLLSRAIDALRVSKAVQQEGGLDRQDGLLVAAELKDADGRSVSYSGVLKRIADAAKAEGKTYEEYRNVIDNILYGHREYNLREKNKELPTDEQVDLFLDDAQIDRAEAAFQADPFIKQVSADLDTIRFNLLDTLVDTGRISPERAQEYKDATGYLPFQRLGDYENKWDQSRVGKNRGAAALKEIRRLEGSKRQSASVIENFSGLVDWATSEAMKNEAASRALDDMLLMGAAKRGGKPATDSPGGVVEVYKDGVKRQFYVPDPAHLVAFSIADPQLSAVFKAMQRGSQLLRAGVTAMPPFAIKQVFDDVVRAYTYAGVKNNAELVKNVLTNFPKNWFNEIFKRKADSIRDMERLGIVGTFDFTQQTNLKNILTEAGAKKEGLGSAILRVMEAGAKASDLAVRQAIYKQVLKETGDTAQAESAAREIINFSRRGSSKLMGIMISVIPFFNAYARGMDKLATAAAGKAVGQTTGTARSMFYKRMMVLTAMGFTYALMMQDDEEYEKLPDHVRDTNWVLPYGKELGFVPVIPVPPELAFFFKAIPERIVRYMKYQGTPEEQTAMSVLGDLTKRGIDVFSSPNITPQVLRPVLENIANYSFFLGRPLESQAQLALRPFERYGTGTSDAMKAVARGLEDVANATGIESFAISPIKLENLVRGLMGTGAGIALSLADAAVNPSRTDRPLHQQLTPQLTGASALMKNAVGTRFMDEIYSLEKRTEQVYGTYNRLLKTDPAGAEQFVKDNIGMYAIRDSVQAVMDAIRTLNEAAMTIDRDTSLSPEERRKRIDELRAEQNEIARVVFSLRNQARAIQAEQ